MQRVTKQIEEYNRNIDILKDSELKFIVECSCLLERLDRKFKSLYEYATNLPRKIEIEVLEHNSVVERKLSSQGLPVS